MRILGSLQMLTDHHEHDLRAFLDLEIPGAEPERRDSDVLDLPRLDALQSAGEGVAYGISRYRLGAAHHDSVDKKFDWQLAGGRDDRGTDGQRLLKTDLIGELRSCGKLEPTEKRRRRTEIFVHRSDDCLSVEERQIVDADVDHRRCASRAL